MIDCFRGWSAAGIARHEGRLTSAMLAALIIATLATPLESGAQTAAQQQARAREMQARALLAKYPASPGRDDSDGLLKKPALVEAAIFSRGKATVFTTAEKYEYVTLCVKDWITLVNSGHRDRFTWPNNVQVQRAR